MSRKVKFKVKIETATNQPVGGPFDSEEDFLKWISELPAPLGIVLLGTDTEFRKTFEANLRATIMERNGGDRKRYNNITIGKETHISQVKFPHPQMDSLVSLSGAASIGTSKRSRAISILRTRAKVYSTLVICLQEVTLALSSKRNSARYTKDAEFRTANSLIENPPTFREGRSLDQIPDLIATVQV